MSDRKAKSESFSWQFYAQKIVEIIRTKRKILANVGLDITSFEIV